MRHAVQRNGVTLVQLTIAISVSGVLLGLTAAWLHQTLHFSASVRDRQRHHLGMLQLAEHLRSDGQQSLSMELLNDDKLLLTNGSGITTRYLIEAGWIRLERKNGDTVLLREKFQLAPNAVANWDNSELPEWITLTITRGRVGVGEDSLRMENKTYSPNPLPVDLRVRVGSNRWPKLAH